MCTAPNKPMIINRCRKLQRKLLSAILEKKNWFCVKMIAPFVRLITLLFRIKSLRAGAREYCESESQRRAKASKRQ